MKILKLIYLAIWIAVIAYFAWILTPLKFVGAMICIGGLAFWSFVVAAGSTHKSMTSRRSLAKWSSSRAKKWQISSRRLPTCHSRRILERGSWLLTVSNCRNLILAIRRSIACATRHSVQSSCCVPTPAMARCWRRNNPIMKKAGRALAFVVSGI